jgi:DNA-binding MarR family transcriptional regulator
LAKLNLAVKSLSGKIVCMGTWDATDALDEIVDEVRVWLPDVDVAGLPITGRILRLARYLEARREAELERFGLSSGDFDLLATVRRRATAEPIKIRDLQRSMMLSSGGTTKRLDRLEAVGLIDRRPDPNDRRGTLVALTPAGVDLIDRAAPVVVMNEAELVKTAIGSARDRAVVEAGLRRMLVDEEAVARAAP